MACLQAWCPFHWWYYDQSPNFMKIVEPMDYTRLIQSQQNVAHMMTSSNGNIFRENWPFVQGIHRSLVNSQHKGQGSGALNFFFDLHLNKRLSKQSWGWWFETLSHPLWHHCNAYPRQQCCLGICKLALWLDLYQRKFTQTYSNQIWYSVDIS